MFLGGLARTRTPKENPKVQQVDFGTGKFPMGQVNSVQGFHHS